MEKVGLDALTEAQKTTLRLYYRRLTAAEVAGILKISVATVNQRLERARRTLGTTSSMEASRLLAEAEDAGLYDRIIYEGFPVADEQQTSSPGIRSWPWWPWRLNGDQGNRLDVVQRTLAIVAIAIGAVAGLGIFMIGVVWLDGRLRP